MERLELEPVALVKLVLEFDPMKAKGVEEALEDIHTLVVVGEWWVNGGSWVVGGGESKRRSAGGSAGGNARQEGAREEADDSWDVESEYTGQRTK